MEEFYWWVTDDRAKIVLEDREGNELGRYADQQALETAVAKRGSNLLMPRER